MQRQLAAILYADVAGYSRLTGRDEEETHRKLNDGLNLLTAAIEAHGGRKIHEAGDAILGEFQSVTAAVQSSLAFQAQMAERNEALPDVNRFEFRVGVNVGEVIHDRNDIYGEGVNLAARIQELAEPGGVCVSASVHEQVQGKIHQLFEDLGHRRFKNIDQSVRVFRTHPTQDRSGGRFVSLFDREAVDTRSIITGGCMCGDVSYEINQPAAGAGYCHCRMCQRASGAPVSAWVVFPRDAIRFTNAEPKYYCSSPIGQRGFCANCGTTVTMGYYAPERSDVLAIMIPTLDHPENFAPTQHTGTESQLPWFEVHDDLPRAPSDQSSNLRRRWSAVGVPDPSFWT